MAEEKKMVVCIEDEPEMIDLVKLIVGRKGYDLVGAVGGREGLETVRRLKPSLVLLDLMMLPLIAAGAFAGIYLLKKIPQKAFSAVVQLLAAAAAAKLALSWWL